MKVVAIPRTLCKNTEATMGVFEAYIAAQGRVQGDEPSLNRSYVWLFYCVKAATK